MREVYTKISLFRKAGAGSIYDKAIDWWRKTPGSAPHHANSTLLTWRNSTSLSSTSGKSVLPMWRPRHLCRPFASRLRTFCQSYLSSFRRST